MQKKYFNSNVLVVSNAHKEDQSHKDTKRAVSKPIEENLSAEFKKKLQEWRIKVLSFKR